MTAFESVAAYGPWGDHIAGLEGWLNSDQKAEREPADLPRVVGFADSPFVRLADAVLRDCLPAPEHRPRTGIVLASVLGDIATANRASAAVAIGQKPSALLFYQSVPTAVLGHVCAEFGLQGPLVCLSGAADLCADACEIAEQLLEEGSADRVLVVYVETPVDGWAEAAAVELGAYYGVPVVPDVTVGIGVSVRAGGVAPGRPEAAVMSSRAVPLEDFARLALTAARELASDRSGPPYGGQVS